MYCDNCGKYISFGFKNDISRKKDEDGFFKECINRIKEAELPTMKSGFGKFLYKKFGYPEMPISYRQGIDFCNQKCYDEWKVKFGELVEKRIAKLRSKKNEKTF